MNGITAALVWLGEMTGLYRQKDAQKNAPDVKEAAKGANDARAADEARKIVENQDSEEFRKGIS